MRVAHGFVVLLAALSVAARADEGEVAPAREAYRQGVDAFNQQKYDIAELSFLRVYDLTHSAEVLYDLAVVLEKQHRWGEAAERYRTYLHESVKVRDQTRIRARIVDLEGRQKRQDEVDRALAEGRTESAAQAQAPGNQVLALEEESLRPPEAEPAPPPPVAKPLQVAPPIQQTERTPVYRRWWLWTAVGAAVVVAAVVAIAVVVTRAPAESPTTFMDIGPGAPLVRF